MSGIAAVGALLGLTAPTAIAQPPANLAPDYYYPAPGTASPAPGYYYPALAAPRPLAGYDYPAAGAPSPPPGHYSFSAYSAPAANPAPASSYPAPSRGCFGFPRGRGVPQPGGNDTYAYKS